MKNYDMTTMQIANNNEVIVDFEENGETKTAVYTSTLNIKGEYDVETLQFANGNQVICDVLDNGKYIGTEEFEFAYVI